MMEFFWRRLGKILIWQKFFGTWESNYKKTPSKREEETFWTSMCGTGKHYNEEAEWLKREEEQCEGLE